MKLCKIVIVERGVGAERLKEKAARQEFIKKYHDTRLRFRLLKRSLTGMRHAGPPASRIQICYDVVFSR